MKHNDTVFTRLYEGAIRKNPTVVLCLGLCPTLAVSATAQNALAMGIVLTIVMVLTLFFVSLLKNLLKGEFRIFYYIMISAVMTILTGMFLEAFFPEIHEALGVFVSLCAVNGIILSRAEDYAVKKNPFLALFDGLGMGIGFTFIITLLGAIREILGIGTIFGIRIIPDGYTISIAALAPGAFFLLACLIAAANKIRRSRS